MQAITLTENLHHPGYSWPESLVFLPGKAPAEQPFHLVDAQGRVYAAQRTKEGTIALCTALLCGEEKRFQPMPGRAEQALRWRRTKGEIWADNGKIALVVREDGDVLFTLQSAGAGFRGVARLNVPLAEKHVALVQAGDVFCDVCIEARAAVGAAIACRCGWRWAWNTWKCARKCTALPRTARRSSSSGRAFGPRTA